MSSLQPVTDSGASPLVDSPPVVMAPRADGAEVVWSVTAHARGWVEWAVAPAEDGESPATWTRQACNADGFVPQGTRVLRQRLDGWEPGTHYVVRTITEGAGEGDDRREVSPWKAVRTLDPQAASSSFVVWNDTHQRTETLRRLADASPQADVWVWNGDVCNNWNDPDEIVPTILAPGDRDVTVGRPMAFVRGNHDVRGPWAYRLSEVVATPDDLAYYAFRSGPIAAIVLHTGEDKPDDHPSFGGRPAFERLREIQAAWLAEQIRRPGFADAPYRVVFCHLPLRWEHEPVLTEHDYATGDFDHYARSSRDLWHDSLVAWGTQIVISGHTHRSAWFPANDAFPYAQITGGAPEGWSATWIHGTADHSALTVRACRLDASVLHEATFAPLS